MSISLAVEQHTEPCRRNPAMHDSELWSPGGTASLTPWSGSSVLSSQRRRAHDFAARGGRGRHVFGVGEVLEIISKQTQMNKFIVDLGASVRGHGKTGVANQDACFPLFDAGYSGLMVDGDPKQRVAMRKRFPSPSIQVVNTFLSPENVVAILRGANTPIDADLIKVDIDGFDCAVMAAVLDAYTPKVVQMEVNVVFPPPLRFALLSMEHYDSDKRGALYGCSLAYQIDMMRRHGYALLQMEWNDAIFVQRHLVPHLLPRRRPPSACEAYMQGYAEHPGVYHLFYFHAPAPGKGIWGRHGHANVSTWPATKQLAKVRSFLTSPRTRRPYAGRKIALSATPLTKAYFESQARRRRTEWRRRRAQRTGGLVGHRWVSLFFSLLLLLLLSRALPSTAGVGARG